MREIDPSKLTVEENRLCTECALFKNGECAKDPIAYLNKLRSQLSCKDVVALEILVQAVKDKAQEIAPQVKEAYQGFKPESVRMVVKHEIKKLTCVTTQNIYSLRALRK